MKTWVLPIAILLASAWGVPEAKQKIIVRLREPLKAETVKIRLPEVKNERGETRDLETRLELGDKPKPDASKAAVTALKLNLAVKSVGKNAVQVTLTLPQAGFVELMVMDFYGKNLATLLAGPMPPGVYPMAPYVFKDGDHNGIKFMTLRIGGKMAMKRVITKVR
jgi:hypothetical protein